MRFRRFPGACVVGECLNCAFAISVGMVAIGSLDHAFGGAQDACDITLWCSRG
jgi:hypothetical protein